MANWEITEEVGNIEQLVSLGGVKQVYPGKGRQVINPSLTGSTTTQVILPANPKRIAAIVQNLDDVAAPGSLVYVYLGIFKTVPFGFVLNTLGSIQIDSNFPWIGDITIYAPTGSPLVNATEISVT
jgi:hypothetical protein